MQSMREISVLDGLVFFAIVLWSVPAKLSICDLANFFLSVMYNISGTIWPVVSRLMGSSCHVEPHYQNISNPIQQVIIRLAGFAFDQVDYKIGRLFLNESNCRRFLKWRLGRDYETFCKTFTIPESKRHKQVLCYLLDKGITSHENVKQVILYAHGGGFVVGSVPFYLEFLHLLQSQCPDTAVISPEYDLVPESVYPTQVNQVIATYYHIKAKYPAARLVLGGDSAGCALCQSLLLHLSHTQRSARVNEVYKAFYISPWLDLDAVHERSIGQGDFISPLAVKKYGRWYTKGCSSQVDGILQVPEKGIPASPLSASDGALRGSIPSNGLFITCGDAECLRTDALTLVDRLGKGISGIEFHIEPNEIHAYVLTNLYLHRGSSRYDGLDKILRYLNTF